MEQRDRDYYRRRADTELKLAQESVCPEAVKVHYQLANEYLSRIFGVAGDMAGDAPSGGRAAAMFAFDGPGLRRH